MKTLILYATKYGSTLKIAEFMAACLDDAVPRNIEDGPPSVSGFDCVVLGSPLTAGMINRKIKKFAAEHETELLSKRVGLFVSGLQASGEAEYLKQNFPPKLLESAKAKVFLGGVFDPEKCGFAARAIIKAAAKLDAYASFIDEEKIKEFAGKLAR